ncbi:hypothetical protein NIASO_19495 [Niabella soli DSM 19437]|uniref:Uncharacterized protein n=1 Tax=Niabella soli DSM 19437 TaxID=929713 RepID=W0F4W7_9BACT|nr:hypothetical protein NIASO_19495 [Niabella soli DSM 19437]
MNINTLLILESFLMLLNEKNAIKSISNSYL